MRIVVQVAVVCSGLIAAAAAQLPQTSQPAQTPTQLPAAKPAPVRQPAPAADRTLKGEARVHYLAKRLNFTASQKATFDSLLEVYRQTLQEEQANLATILYEIRARVAEIQELERQGKHTEAEAARKEIDKLRPGKQAENEIMANIRAMLVPEQLLDLDFLIDRMDRNKATSAMAPMDVIEAAVFAGADAEQKAKLSKIENEFRERINSAGAPIDREKVLAEFTRDVRGLLRPDQQEKFDRRIKICEPEQLFVAQGNPVEHIGKPVPKENVVRPLGPSSATQPAEPKK